MDQGAALLLNVHQWPRYRRLARTGPNNPNYKHGRYTWRRRKRLEEPLNRAMRDLSALSIVTLERRIDRLPKGTRERAKAMLVRLGEFFPGRWALPDPRRSERNPAWYVPRRAWALCARWLRLWRALQRLVFWGASLISQPMPTSYGGGTTGSLSGMLRSTGEERRKGELARFRDWCARQGLSGEPTA